MVIGSIAFGPALKTFTKKWKKILASLLLIPTDMSSTICLVQQNFLCNNGVGTITLCMVVCFSLCIRLFICWLVLVLDYLFVGFYLYHTVTCWLLLFYLFVIFCWLLYIWFPIVCGFAGVPAGMRISADSGYGYCFMPVAGCGRGRGRGFWLAGAGLSNPYPCGFYPLPSWFRKFPNPRGWASLSEA